MPNVKNISYIFLFTALVFMASCKPGQSSTPQYVTPVKSTEGNTPFPSLTLESTTAKQPPACTFPLAQTTIAESTPETYTFSEPKVVLTALEGNPYDIAGWLPDNQQVLITEGLRNEYVENNNTASQQSISLYNLETGESKLYAMRTEISDPPIWRPDINGVVYSVMNYTSIDKKNATSKFTRQLWVSYGDPNAAQLLADNLPQLPFAIKSDGSETMYLSDKQISKLDKSLKKLSSTSFDPA